MGEISLRGGDIDDCLGGGGRRGNPSFGCAKLAGVELFGASGNNVPSVERAGGGGKIEFMFWGEGFNPVGGGGRPGKAPCNGGCAFAEFGEVGRPVFNGGGRLIELLPGIGGKLPNCAGNCGRLPPFALFGEATGIGVGFEIDSEGN